MLAVVVVVVLLLLLVEVVVLLLLTLLLAPLRSISETYGEDPFLIQVHKDPCGEFLALSLLFILK